MLDSPHRRFNPLTGDWVLVSPHRAKRPWLGQVEKTPLENLPQYDPTCYLCPRNDAVAESKTRITAGHFRSIMTLPRFCRIPLETHRHRTLRCWPPNPNAASAGSSVSRRVTI